MARVRTGLYPPKRVSADTTVLSHQISKYGEWVLTSAGVRLTLPTPTKWMQRSEFTVANASAGYAIVDCTGYMLDGGNSIIIGPYDQVVMKVIATAAGTYKWATIGTFERGA